MVLASAAHVAVGALMIAFGVGVAVWRWKNTPWWVRSFRDAEDQDSAERASRDG